MALPCPDRTCLLRMPARDIGEYNATTGAVVNATLVSGLSYPAGIAVVQGSLAPSATALRCGRCGTVARPQP